MAPALRPRPLAPGEMLRPGDVILTRESGFFGWLIRWGTKTGRKGINHAGVVASYQTEPGAPVETLEAMTSGVVKTVRFQMTGYAFRLTEDPETAADLVKAARRFLGTPYDWVGILRFTVVCLRLRWWGRPLAPLVAAVLPKEDDDTAVFCSDHIAQAVTAVFGDLGLGPSYTVAPIDLLRRFIGFGVHISDDRQQPF